MARYALRLCALCGVLLFLLGCAPAGPVLSVIRGNLAYGRGDYQAALLHYLSAEHDAADQGWLLFNTANVYYALGEQEAALEAWDQARQAVTARDSERRAAATSLIHAASYNRGVLLYQQGEYRAAYDEFRYALRVESRNVAAKENLELALQKTVAAEQGAQAGSVADPVSGEIDDGRGPTTLRILEYVRRKEAQRWHASREIDEPTDPRDW